MEKRNALDSSGLPPALLKAAPRPVRVTAQGGVTLLVAGVLVVGGIWGGLVLGRRAEAAERRVGLFASERVVTAGDVIRLRRRGGNNDDYRVSAEYRYVARGRELTGETALRRNERDRYVVGAPIAVWYLPTEPESSWIDGHAPEPEPSWPGTAAPIVCGIAAMALIQAVRRQFNLLAYGRAAMATVTRLEKKTSDKGTFWVVHYEWTTMSGATRTGKYNHSKKHAPAPGELVAIVYDRDDTFRHQKYPMGLVTVRASAPPRSSLSRAAHRAPR